MKARIKFAKYGVMKFVSHLDVMRFFQKAIRRAGLDVVYSDGFNPHQILSFASPLGVGQTSEGEYFEVELHQAPSVQEIMDRLNLAMPEGMKILAAELLPEYIINTKKETAMALVSASDYLILRKDGYYDQISTEELKSKFNEFIHQQEIMAVKKTKNSETELNIAPFIYSSDANGNTTSFSGAYENGLCFYMLLSAGSVNNLKPEVVMEAFFQYLQIPFNGQAFQIHRLETYTDLSVSCISQAEQIVRMQEGTLPQRELVSLLTYHIQK